jgi:carboxymethylenebutenolidase
VTAETIDITTADGTADAFFARPDGEGPHPGVILYMDAYGIRPALQDHVKRLARNGYCVLAPNVFYRSRRAPVLDDLEEMMRSEDRSALWAQLRPMIDQVTPEAAHRDSGAWLGFMHAADGVAAGRLGTVGYCMGGRLSLRMAGEYPEAIGAAATFHGGNMATDEEDSPHLSAVKATAELYIGHADNDGSMPPEQMARLTQALAEAHVRHTAELYVGAAHGWTQTDTPAYDELSTDRHWVRLLELFERVL